MRIQFLKLLNYVRHLLVLIPTLYAIPAIASFRGGDRYLYQDMYRGDAGGLFTYLLAIVLGLAILWGLIRHHNFRVAFLGLAAIAFGPIFAFHYWGKLGGVISLIVILFAARWAFRNWLK